MLRTGLRGSCQAACRGVVSAPPKHSALSERMAKQEELCEVGNAAFKLAQAHSVSMGQRFLGRQWESGRRCFSSGQAVNAEICGDSTADTVSHNPETRSRYVESAADDFVNDYRELAKLPAWERLLENRSEDFRVLDVCCGTGRWAQAFADVALKGQKAKCDFIDLCSDSTRAMSQRLDAIPNLEGTVFTGDICEMSDLGVPSIAYDLIVNMHGLYGVPTAMLPAALQAMYDALRPGGTMILSIGADDSPYQQVPKQCLGTSFTDSADIVRALGGLGIRASISHIQYHEEYAATNQEGIDRFLLEECGGNTFPTDVAQNMAFNSVAGYQSKHFDKSSGTYRFPQNIAVITVHRDSAFLPEMQSFGNFYSEAYTLRRQASTMQSNMIKWLQSNAKAHILEGLDKLQEKRMLKICSIGCGDGELDVALMEGLAHSVEKWGYSGIEFVGLEPSTSFRRKFEENIKDARNRGVFPPPEHCSFELVGEAFDPSNLPMKGQADVVLLGHVMYYFEEKASALRSAMEIARPGGLTVVIHQCKQGVPRLQEALLPQLRGSVRDMFTADDIENILVANLDKNVGSFDRHDVEAFLDVSEITKGTEDGLKIMSFCLEADHRTATSNTVKKSRDAFVDLAVPEAESGRIGGPFLPEPVSCFVIRPQ